MRRTYRIRPGRGESGCGAVVALVATVGGLALMNATSIKPPAVFQLLWAFVGLVSFILSLYNALSDKGIATDLIQEEIEPGKGALPAEPEDTASLLRELETLRSEGLVSEEEYQAKRQAVLSKFG